MKEDIVLSAYPGNFRQGLNGPDLRVGMLDGNQDSIFPDGFLYILRRYLAEAVNGKQGDLKTVLAETARRIEDGEMVNLRNDDMPALLPIGFGDAFYGKIIGFRGAGGKIYLAFLPANQMGDLTARLFHGVFGGGA